MNEILNMEQQNNQENNPKLPIKKTCMSFGKPVFPQVIAGNCWQPVDEIDPKEVHMVLHIGTPCSCFAH